jgi:type IV secretion system protein VirD4
MMPWSHWSTLTFVLSFILGLIGLGIAFTVVMLVIRACLACLTLSSWGIGRLWGWLTGSPPDSHGTAHFADAAEIAAAGLLNATGLPLAHTAAGQVLREPVSSHVALIAPARSHKSWGVIMPCLCDWKGSCVINDLRGELYTMTHDARESVGPVFRYAPTERESCDLNPLDLIRWGSDQEYGDIQRVVMGLLSPEPGEAWSEYSLEAVPLLTALVLDQHAHGHGSLGAVVQWLVKPGTTLTKKFEALEKSPQSLVSAGARRMLDKSDTRMGAVVQALLMSLNVFADPLVQQHTSRSDIDLNDLQHGSLPVSVFLCSPFAEQRRLRPLWACLLEQLIARFSAQEQVPRHRVLLCLDEAMNLGTLPELETGMSYLTGCGVQVLLAFQNRRQALHTYGEWSSILDSVPTTIYYTPVATDRVTLQEISQALGVTTAAYETRTDTVSVWGLLQRQTLGSSRTERPLMTPDEVSRLADNACLVLTKGHPPVLGLKLDALPSPVHAIVQRAKPVVKRVALATAACLVAGLIGTWALWPKPTPPPPTLSLTTETPTPRLARTTGGAPDNPQNLPDLIEKLRQGPQETDGTDTKAGRFARLTEEPPAKPWTLYSHTVIGRMAYPASGHSLLSGSYATLAECQEQLHAQTEPRILQLREQAAVQRGLKVAVKDKENYVAIEKQLAGPMSQTERIESVCYLNEDQPT